jgi:ribosomal 50S subunit-recycling heat shock protein
MRIDLCLSRLCLMKTRSQAGKACDEGRVFLNGQPARAAREGNVSRQDARELYRVVGRRALEDPWEGGPKAEPE